MEIQEWQKGSESKTPISERIMLHNEWLKKIHEQVQEEIKKSNPTKEEEVFLGGFDD